MLEDIEFNLVWNCSTGVLLVGAPRMGKSIGIETLAHSVCLSLPPEWVEIIAFDWKEGKSLKKFEIFPHLRMPCFTNLNTRDPKEVIGLFEHLQRQREDRGKKIVTAGCANIQEYNRKFPDKPLRWTILVIDEVAPFKVWLDGIDPTDDSDQIKKRKNSIADYWFYEILSRWRSDGYVMIAGIQYTPQGLGFEPGARLCFGSAVAYRSSPTGAKLAFSEDGADEYIKNCPRLYRGGDCVIKNDGVFVRGQTLMLSPQVQQPLYERIERAWKYKPTPWRAQPALSGGTINQPALPALKTQSLPSAQSVGTVEAVEAIEAVEPFDLSVAGFEIPDKLPLPADLRGKSDNPNVQAWARLWIYRQNNGKFPDSISKLLETAFGHEYDDPKKAHRGSYEKNKTRLINALKAVGQFKIAEWVQQGGSSAA